MLLAAACGLIVANLYYAQPLAGPIAAELGMSATASGLIVTMTQMGYCAGLLLLVPLADLVENRALIVRLTTLAAVALMIAAVASGPGLFLLAALLIGLFSVAVQVLVPLAAHLAPAAIRGRVVGSVMSGLMLGIMLARPVSSLVAHVLSWHAIFLISAALMIGMALILRGSLPTRTPTARHTYGELLLSMWHLLAGTRVLQRRAFYHACMFGAFSLFWTVTPMVLAGPRFQLSQVGIAVFALLGVSGALMAPVAGRMADRGWIFGGTIMAMLMAAGAFVLTWMVPEAWLLGALTLAGIVLDSGVAAHLVLSQRVLYGLPAEHRSRLNGLFMALFFLGGAAGSALGAWSFVEGGWRLASMLAVGLVVLGLGGCLTERLGADRLARG